MKPIFYKKVLNNGMTVIFEKREVPVVSVAFAVRVGGINESESEKGISHFIEHMLYKGTPSRDAKKIAEEIEKNGGELNGFTDENITAYWCKMPSKHLNVALNVLSDMVKNPLFDEKELEKERKVIFEEIKMRKDSPMIYVFDKIKELLYEKPFSVNLAGTIESMNSINKKFIFDKFKSDYSTNNLILCVVGNAEFEKILEFAENNFVKSNNLVKDYKIKLKNESKLEKRKGIDQANFIFAYHSPLFGDPLSSASIILNTILAGGMSSRLFSEIREKRNLAYAVKGDSEVTNKFAYNIIYVGTMKENIDKVKEIILNEIRDVSENLSQKELDEAKEQLIGNYQISMEDSQTQMVELLKHEVSGDAKKFYEFESEISKVKLLDVKNIAKKVLKKYSSFALIPD